MKVKFFVVIGLIFTIGQAWALTDENRPEYQKEFDAYLKDLDIIAQTGRAPKNPVLEADLAKMNSEEKILLTALPTNSVKIAQNNAQIVNQVEVIRVPEEFREKYADVYKEQNKTISTQSLVDVNYDVQKKIIKDSSAVKVSSHINPFRFLKEIELSPVTDGKNGIAELPKDPMVNAYFNQFGRAYVSNSSEEKVIPSPQKTAPQPRKKASGNIIQDMSLRNSMFAD